MASGGGGRAQAEHLVAEALALHQAGRLAEAAPIYMEALARAPRHARATQLFGTLLVQQGRHADAVPYLEIASAVDPKNANTLSNLGVALNGAGRAEAALATLDRAIRAEPRFDQAHSNRGMVLKALRRLPEAAQSYRRAIALRPAEAGFHLNLANVLSELGDPKAAEAEYREAMRLRPAYPAAAQGLSRLLADAGQREAALALLQDSLRRMPKAALLHHEVGRVLQALGRLAEAAEAYREAIALDPRYGEARFHLAHLLASGHTDAERDGAMALFHDGLVPIDARVYSGFAAARILGDEGRHDESVATYDAVNALQRSRSPFDLAVWQGDMAARFSAQSALPIAATPEPGPSPIFIVGLPRSGKSTLEAILATQPGIVALGEQQAFQLALSRHPLAAGAASGQSAALAETGREYLAAFAGRAGPGELTIDTMPANLLHIGVILAALPGARILWSLRDPVDHAIALYEKYLPQQGYDYAYDLDDALAVVQASARDAARWTALFPQRVMTVRLSPEGGLSEVDARTIQVFLGTESAVPLPESAQSEPRIAAFSRDAETVARRAHMAAYRRLHPQLWRGRGGNLEA